MYEKMITDSCVFDGYTFGAIEDEDEDDDPNKK